MVVADSTWAVDQEVDRNNQLAVKDLAGRVPADMELVDIDQVRHIVAVVVQGYRSSCSCLADLDRLDRHM